MVEVVDGRIAVPEYRSTSGLRRAETPDPHSGTEAGRTHLRTGNGDGASGQPDAAAGGDPAADLGGSAGTATHGRRAGPEPGRRGDRRALRRTRGFGVPDGPGSVRQSDAGRYRGPGGHRGTQCGHGGVRRRSHEVRDVAAYRYLGHCRKFVGPEVS
ncbi:hypothetical protein D9M72_552940 [compost metagenome]